MNILIVKLSSIGDVIHTLPSLNAIRQKFPDAKITWLVEEAASDFVTGHRALNRVIVSKRKKWIKDIISRKSLITIKEIYSFIKKLRDTKYDIIIDFQTLLKSGILVGLSRGKRKIGYGRGMEHMEYSYLFLNERISPVDMNNHAILRSLNILNSIGISTEKIEYNLPVSNDDQKKAADLLKDHDADALKPLIAINPVAKWETKLWDNNRFAKLADHLIKEHKASVVFTGSSEDHKTICDIITQMEEKAANLAGKTTLKMLAAVYEKASLVISTDTGPMHVAAAAGTRVVALFGPTAPWRTGPFGKEHRVIRAGIECSPCFKRKCDTCRCMKLITVEQLLNSISI